MKEKLKYDPEDLESLLLHKAFNELYPEEKEFVLRHMEGPSEYESMRKTLLDVIHASNNEPWLEPDHSIKSNLMKYYASEEQRGFRIWLNTMFAQVNSWLAPRPTLRYAMAGLAVVAIVVSVWLVSTPEVEPLIAENRTDVSGDVESKGEADSASVLTDANTPEAKLAEEVAEMIAEAPIPPAPADMVMFNMVEDVADANNFQDSNLAEKSVEQLPKTAATANTGATTEGAKTAEPAIAEAEDVVGTDMAESPATIDAKDEVMLLESVTIASSSRRNLDSVTKMKTRKNAESGVALSELDELLSLLYTAP